MLCTITVHVIVHICTVNKLDVTVVVAIVHTRMVKVNKVLTYSLLLYGQICGNQTMNSPVFHIRKFMILLPTKDCHMLRQVL